MKLHSVLKKDGTIVTGVQPGMDEEFLFEALRQSRDLMAVGRHVPAGLCSGNLSIDSGGRRDEHTTGPIPPQTGSAHVDILRPIRPLLLC